MAQSRTMSLVESIANVLAGFGVAVATQIAVFPLFKLHTSLTENPDDGRHLHSCVDRPVALPEKGVRADSGARAERSNAAGQRCPAAL